MEVAKNAINRLFVFRQKVHVGTSSVMPHITPNYRTSTCAVITDLLKSCKDCKRKRALSGTVKMNELRNLLLAY